MAIGNLKQMEEADVGMNGNALYAVEMETIDFRSVRTADRKWKGNMMVNRDKIIEIIDNYRNRIMNAEEADDITSEIIGNMWIPCSERLPEDNQFVLMTIRRMDEHHNHEPFTSVGYISWNQSVWWCAHDGYCKSNDVRVVAWMPLPEQYKPEGENA